MDDKFRHEALSRGSGAMDRLSRARLTVCGAGAVGSLLVDNLARQGLRNISVIDCDRIEEHNVGTQLYTLDDVGSPKVEVLQSLVFRAVGADIAAINQRLSPENVARLLRNADLVVDSFDNSASRRLVTEHCEAQNIPCMHVGLFDNFAEVAWNEDYRVPKDPGVGDVCNYPMARNVVVFAVALASEAAVRFLLRGERESFSFTMGDLRINAEKHAASQLGAKKR